MKSTACRPSVKPYCLSDRPAVRSMVWVPDVHTAFLLHPTDRWAYECLGVVLAYHLGQQTFLSSESHSRCHVEYHNWLVIIAVAFHQRNYVFWDIPFLLQICFSMLDVEVSIFSASLRAANTLSLSNLLTCQLCFLIPEDFSTVWQISNE